MHFLTVSLQYFYLYQNPGSLPTTGKALDLPFHDILAPQKVPLLKIFDHVIAWYLWFATPQIKNPSYAYGYSGYLLPVTVTPDVIGQLYVKLFFILELVLAMIRVGAQIRL